MDNLKDKVVLITGASRGIGAVTAVLFAKHGCRLVLTGRNIERLNKTVEECVAAGLDKNHVLAMTGDITVDEDMKKLVEAAIVKFNTIHILVNNAAMIKPGNIQELGMEDFDLTYKTNLRGPIYLSKLCIPHLKDNAGAIINVSAVVAERPVIHNSSYCIMKSGLDMLTKSLALELAEDGIRVNAIRPGAVRTGVHARCIGISEESEEAREIYRTLGQQTPMGRVGTSKEIAHVILFLASDASSFTTGTFLDIDGGIVHTAAWTHNIIEF